MSGGAGALRSWFLVVQDWTKPAAEAAHLHDAHLAWLRELYDSGHVVMGGPKADKTGGMLVFRASSQEEVEGLCRRDPFVADGFRSVQVVPWEVRQILGTGPFTREATAAIRADQAKL